MRRTLLGLSATSGLALAAIASSAALTAEVQRPTIKLGRGREEDLATLRKVSLRKSRTPKKGKLTKAEKKAAKRARSRGVLVAGDQSLSHQTPMTSGKAGE